MGDGAQVRVEGLLVFVRRRKADSGTAEFRRGDVTPAECGDERDGLRVAGEGALCWRAKRGDLGGSFGDGVLAG